WGWWKQWWWRCGVAAKPRWGDGVAVVMVDLWWGVVEMSGGMAAWVRGMEANDGNGGMCRSRWGDLLEGWKRMG
nr:hypothetical protein [Tanacetum cinerariifolium]